MCVCVFVCVCVYICYAHYAFLYYCISLIHTDTGSALVSENTFKQLTKEVSKWILTTKELSEDVFWIAECKSFKGIAVMIMSPFESDHNRERKREKMKQA